MVEIVSNVGRAIACSSRGRRWPERLWTNERTLRRHDRGSAVLQSRRMLLTMTEMLTPITIRGTNGFDRCVSDCEGRPLHGVSIDTVQVNVGLRCNLACHHCHVESGPNRKEEMSWETMSAVLAAARSAGRHNADRSRRWSGAPGPAGNPGCRANRSRPDGQRGFRRALCVVAWGGIVRHAQHGILPVRTRD